MKDLEYYMNLPWDYTVFKEEENGETFWFARVEELRCFSEGRTKEEAVANIKEALKAHITTCLETGAIIPEVECHVPKNMETTSS